MRIVFVGVVDFSYHCLEEIIRNKGNVVGVLTLQQTSFNSDYKDLTPLAQKHGIPIFYIDNINSDDTFATIETLHPDVIFCFGWSQLIKSRVLNYPKLGIIGVHPAKLPENRGRHPLIWALVLGLESSALTFFRMDEGADTGDIISQKEFRIEYQDDAASLYEKIKLMASEQISEFLPELTNGTIEYRHQGSSIGNSWRKRGKADGKIDWRMSSRAIYNLVRGLSKPYVGAHCEYKGQEIKIWKVEEVEGYAANIEPGKVVKSADGMIVVKVADHEIALVEHEFEEIPQMGEYLS